MFSQLLIELSNGDYSERMECPKIKFEKHYAFSAAELQFRNFLHELKFWKVELLLVQCFPIRRRFTFFMKLEHNFVLSHALFKVSSLILPTTAVIIFLCSTMKCTDVQRIFCLRRHHKDDITQRQIRRAQREGNWSFLSTQIFWRLLFEYSSPLFS